jgi:hypothetical protein
MLICCCSFGENVFHDRKCQNWPFHLCAALQFERETRGFHRKVGCIIMFSRYTNLSYMFEFEAKINCAVHIVHTIICLCVTLNVKEKSCTVSAGASIKCILAFNLLLWRSFSAFFQRMSLIYIKFNIV